MELCALFDSLSLDVLMFFPLYMYNMELFDIACKSFHNVLLLVCTTWNCVHYLMQYIKSLHVLSPIDEYHMQL